MRFIAILVFACFELFAQSAVAPGARAVHGLVVDATTHRPVANAWITVDGNTSKTGANGEFQVKTKASSVDLRAAGYGRLHVLIDGAEMRIPFRP